MTIFYTDTDTYRLEPLDAAEFTLTVETPHADHRWPSDALVSRWAGRPLVRTEHPQPHMCVYDTVTR